MIARCRWLLLLMLLLVPRLAGACTIPVFRYALERWTPASYELVIFHRGPLPQDHLLIVNQLEDYTPKPNVSITCVDLAEEVAEDKRQLWEKQNAADKLPWAVLRYPDADAKTPDVWAGPLDTSTIAECFTSHSRTAVLDHLGRGASAVFVLLESGDAVADKTALDLLSKELRQLEAAIKIPEQNPLVSPLQSNLPLTVSFPVVRLERSALAEGPFVRMLLSSELELDKAQGPMAFPIFGRGRLLCSLHGDDLSAGRLGDVARFLCGACSCRVKELNPGVDLLMAADWDDMLNHPATTIVGGSGGPGDASKPLGLEPKELLVPTPAVVENTSDLRRWLWIGVGFASGLVAVTGVWVVASLWRKKPETP